MIFKTDWFRADTEWLIEKLTIYSESIETAIAGVRDEDRERIKKMEIHSADDFDEQREQLHVHALLFDKDFPSKLRYSYVLLCYMFFEARAKALTEELHRRKRVATDVSKLTKAFRRNSFADS